MSREARDWRLETGDWRRTRSEKREAKSEKRDNGERVHQEGPAFARLQHGTHEGYEERRNSVNSKRIYHERHEIHEKPQDTDYQLTTGNATTQPFDLAQGRQRNNSATTICVYLRASAVASVFV